MRDFFKLLSPYQNIWTLEGSVSEALILETVNPQYDERLFIKFHEKYKLKTRCVQKLFFCFCFDIQNNVCIQQIKKYNKLWTCIFQGNSMNNLLSYCGLTDARMRASEKDLPVIYDAKFGSIYIPTYYNLPK